MPKTIILSRRALTLIPATAYDPRSALSLNLGLAYWQTGQIVEAEGAFSEAQEMAHKAQNHHVRLLAIGFLSIVQASQGRLYMAADLLHSALAGCADIPANALPHLVQGALLYEWNQLEEAGAHLQKAITLAQRSKNRELESSAYRQLARLLQAKGDQAAASTALTVAEGTAGDNAPQITRDRIQATAVIIALAQNDLQTAQRRAKQIQTAASASLFYVPLFLIPARLYLAQGNGSAAEEHLAVEYERAVRSGWRYGQIEIRLLQALSASGSNDALGYLTDALAMAEPQGFRRIFLDKGRSLIPLLRLAVDKSVAADYSRSLLAELEGIVLSPSRPSTPDLPVAALAETISEREIEVLALLADNLTYQEIAQTMFVSVNTVKSHLKSIYGKLGVHNRREAVARARMLHLLDSNE